MISFYPGRRHIIRPNRCPQHMWVVVMVIDQLLRRVEIQIGRRFQCPGLVESFHCGTFQIVGYRCICFALLPRSLFFPFQRYKLKALTLGSSGSWPVQLRERLIGSHPLIFNRRKHWTMANETILVSHLTFVSC
jgi:hypothetical protein